MKIMATHDGMSDAPAADWENLLAALRRLGPLTLAYSGGVDSRFLAHAALAARVPLELVHVCGPHVAPGETEYALDWARRQGLAVHLLPLDPLALPLVASGDRERCYVCKSYLFGRIRAETRGVLCDGSNASDAGEHRPGRRALLELGVLSPLAEAGLTKDAIRSLGRRTGLAWPEQQARACLLTRLPYGMSPDRALLRRLAEGERGVEAALRDAGCADMPFRLRVCGDGLLELHLGTEGVPAALAGVLERTLEGLGMPAVPIRGMTSLSGYFDTTQPVR